MDIDTAPIGWRKYLAFRPVIKYLPLQPSNVRLRLRPRPLPVIIGAPRPPALPRQAIALTHNQHGERGRALAGVYLVYFIQRLANAAHFRAGEAKAKVEEKLGVADRPSLTRALLQHCLDARDVVQRREVGGGVTQKIFQD